MVSTVIARRSALGAVIAIPLVACGRDRSDISAVQAALQQTVESLAVWVDGQIQYQDSATAGTTISGVLTLAGEDRDAVAASLTDVLEAIIRTYSNQPKTRTGFVRVEGHPEGDRSLRVRSADVVRPAKGANVTTDDVVEHFGL